MEMVLVIVGAASFIGYLIWLIVRIVQWDSKIPPIIGMLLSLIMVVGGLAVVPDTTAPKDSPRLQSSETNSKGQDRQDKGEDQRSTTAEPVSDEGSQQKPISDYEITYQDSVVYKDSLGTVSCYVIVEVENTGTTNLHLGSSSFDFEDKNGHLLSTYSTLVSADPDIIAPGEKGYFYCNAASLEGEITENSDYILKPNLKIEEAKNDIVRYKLTDLSISEGDFLSSAVVVGRVTNDTDEDESLAWISCILYRKDGTPIAAYGTNVLDLDAGTTQSFKASSVHLFDLDLKYSDIADYKVYACKTQYQF